jgi:UDP:flavonoid glycosyltransferase YjiC (YdhE family)
MKRKKICFVAPPFSGHLHPLLGIAQHVQSIADVIILSTPSGVAAAETAGLSGRKSIMINENLVRKIAESGRDVKNNPLLLYRQLRDNVHLMVEAKHELDVILREERPDLVIVDSVVPVAGLTAEQQGIPWWTTLPSPCVFETPNSPPVYWNGQKPASAWPQRQKHTVMRTASRCFKHLMWFRFQQQFKHMGFSGVYRNDGGETLYSPRRILALGASEIEFGRAYPPYFHFIGPVLYIPPYQGSPPLFYDDGRPHVLISIGTHLPHAKAALAVAIGNIATRHPDIVFHFTHGQKCESTMKHTNNFHEYSYISYSDHLPRYDLVVHHAGAGVLNYCLSHGIPSVVHPIDFDQFDNASRLVYAGLSIAASRLNDLEPAIIRALHDPVLHQKCSAIKHIYKNYHAEETITQMINEFFSNTSSTQTASTT